MLQKTKFAFLLALLHEDVILKKQPHSKTCAHAWKTGSGKQSLWSPQRCHSGVTTGESESVKQRGEQLDCVPVILLRVPPRPTTRDRHYRPGKTQGGREDRKEGWDWPLPLEEECVEAELKRGGAKGSRGVAPVLSGSVSDSLSVFTLSKSICHRNCGTKREGSLPGRTHSERNEEKTATNGQEWRLCVGGGGMFLILSNIKLHSYCMCHETLKCPFQLTTIKLKRQRIKIGKRSGQDASQTI